METPQADSQCPIEGCLWGLKAPESVNHADMKGKDAIKGWAKQLEALRVHLKEGHQPWWVENAPGDKKLYKDYLNMFSMWPDTPPARFSDEMEDFFS